MLVIEEDHAAGHHQQTEQANHPVDEHHGCGFGLSCRVTRHVDRFDDVSSGAPGHKRIEEKSHVMKARDGAEGNVDRARAQEDLPAHRHQEKRGTKQAKR